MLAWLLGSGFAGVGGFALLADNPAGRRLFCRGSISATVQGSNVLARIDGIGLTTWREYVVATDAERVVLGQPPDGGKIRLSAAAGALPASCVIIDLTGAASRDTVRPDSRVGGDDGEHDLVRDPEKTRTFEEASVATRAPISPASQPRHGRTSCDYLDSTNGTLVALPGRDPEQLRRFTAEANVTAVLAHRHIVQVFDAKVTDDGRPYIVMPFYPQPNLSVRARRAHFSRRPGTSHRHPDRQRRGDQPPP